jgi:hypothetical protein
MPWYVQRDEAWTETDAPDSDTRSVQVQAEDASTPPVVRVLDGGDERLHLTGAAPRPDTDTTHTVAWVPPDATGTLLFAVHAQGTDLIFEDLRSTDGPDAPDSALDHVQSALNEIMIPVYIDDVISDLSERLSGLLVLHTAQYDGGAEGPWTYFRSSVFEDEDLAVEVERGEL